MKRWTDHAEAIPINASAVPMPAFTIVSCQMTRVTQRPDRLMIRPCWRIYWNPESGGEIEYEGQCHVMDPDHAVIIPPNTAIRHILRRPHRHFFVHALLGQPYDSCAGRVFRIPVTPGEKDRISALVQAVDVPADEQISAQTQMRRLNGRENFVVTSFLSRWLSELPDDIWPGRPKDPRIVRVLTAMERLDDVTMDNRTLAESIAMSRNAFVRLFRAQVGMPPQTFLQKRRLTKACLLLQYSDKSIERIAGECGICDRSYLSRLFKRAYGIGPATYRRTSRVVSG